MSLQAPAGFESADALQQSVDERLAGGKSEIVAFLSPSAVVRLGGRQW